MIIPTYFTRFLLPAYHKIALQFSFSVRAIFHFQVRLARLLLIDSFFPFRSLFFLLIAAIIITLMSNYVDNYPQISAIRHSRMSV